MENARKNVQLSSREIPVLSFYIRRKTGGRPGKLGKIEVKFKEKVKENSGTNFLAMVCPHQKLTIIIPKKGLARFV